VFGCLYLKKLEDILLRKVKEMHKVEEGMPNKMVEE
jgi:hypothetical protein